MDTGTRTAAGFAIQSQIAEFCVESEAVAPCSRAHFRAAGRGALTVRALKKVPTACITESVTRTRQGSEVMELSSRKVWRSALPNSTHV